MSEIHVFEGKTTAEAIENGLKQLKTSKDMVDIKVLENEDKRSFFSILTPRIVKVEMTIKEREFNDEKKELSEENFNKAKKNLEDFFEKLKKSLPTKNIEIKISRSISYVLIDIKGENLNYLIGYRGEVLNSLQKIVSAVGNKGIEEKIRFILDIEGYREKREKVLQELADKVAKSVIENKKNKTLEPMSAYERKVIHSRLQNNPKVTTRSIGEEPNRRVIISLKK